MMGPFSLKRRGNQLQIILVCAFHSIPQRNRPVWFSWLLCWFYLIVCIRLEFSQCEMSSIIYMLCSSLIWLGAPDFIRSGFTKLIYCLGFLTCSRKDQFGTMSIPSFLGLHKSCFCFFCKLWQRDPNCVMHVSCSSPFHWLWTFPRCPCFL